MKSKQMLSGLRLLVLAGAMGATACEGVIQPSGQPADDGRTEERQQIEDYLVSQGVDRSRIVFEQDRVYIEEDFFFERGQLLGMMAAGQSMRPANPADLVDKGYWYRQWGTLNRVIGIKFDANVPQDIRSAVRGAAFDWSGTTPCININANNPGPGIRVIFEDVGPATLPPGASFMPGDANGPNGGQPGYIRFNRRWVNAERPDNAALAAVAIHELGHSLGFSHPLTGSHIHGTSTYKKTCTNTVKPAYPTVMDYCGNEYHPTNDDRKSAQLVYGRAGACLN